MPEMDGAIVLVVKAAFPGKAASKAGIQTTEVRMDSRAVVRSLAREC
jgi:hypothetical protein